MIKKPIQEHKFPQRVSAGKHLEWSNEDNFLFMTAFLFIKSNIDLRAFTFFIETEFIHMIKAYVSNEFEKWRGICASVGSVLS